MRPLVFVLGLLPALASAQLSPLPVTFLPGGAGEEGCYQQWSTRSAVSAYSAPTPVSRVLRTVDAQRRIDANDYSESLTAVLEPGLIRLRQPVEAVGYRMGGEASTTFPLRAGDEVTILAFGPEESVYFEREGTIFSGFVPGSYGGDLAEVVREPVTELWVRLVAYSDDRPASWVNTAQAGMALREPFCE
jgi:hypothetical protein